MSETYRVEIATTRNFYTEDHDEFIDAIWELQNHLSEYDLGKKSSATIIRVSDGAVLCKGVRGSCDIRMTAEGLKEQEREGIIVGGQ